MSEAKAPTRLVVSNLCFAYKHAKTKIFENLALSAQAGEVCAILAPNGAGKSTLFRILLGIIGERCASIVLQNYRPKAHDKARNISKTNPKSAPKDTLKDAQEICLHTLSAHKRARYISYMPQFVESPFGYLVLDMVLLGAQVPLFGLPDSAMRDKAMGLLEELGIAHLASMPITHLSGGQRQLVLLAQSLMQESPILLLDEPSAHLDIKNKFLLFEKITEQTRQKGLVTIVNLHDIELIARYATKVYLIDKGRVYAAGSPSEILTKQRLGEFFGLPNLI